MITYGISLNNDIGEIVTIKTTTKIGLGVLTVSGKVSDDILNSVKNALRSLQVPSKTDININISGGLLPLTGPSLGLSILKSLVGALNNKSIIDNDKIYTGCINSKGEIGKVGSMYEKEALAKKYNKELISHTNCSTYNMV